MFDAVLQRGSCCAAHSSNRMSVSRRSMIQAGALGLAGLGMADVARLRGESIGGRVTPKKSVIFLFLTGGISHQDSFDLKPEAPSTVRGEFQPIATRTSGMEICEHLPRLAQRSDRYTLRPDDRSSNHRRAADARPTTARPRRPRVHSVPRRLG